MLARTSLTLLGALLTTSDGRPASLAFGGSWLAVSPASAKVTAWNS
jgi:hypothetical protein